MFCYFNAIWGWTMTKEEYEKMKRYMADQIKEMEIHKWIESEAAGHDLGEDALKDWILKHAVEFRKHWEEEHKNDKN